MPQSLSLILIHIIFSTKDRAQLIDSSIRPQLHAYLATVSRNAGCECFRVGGTADHVHLAISLNRTTTAADMVSTLKTSSTKWLKSQPPISRHFCWQRGYGVFSVSPNHLDVLCHYIANQEEHHHNATFQEEFRAFLKKYAIPFDEQYLWD
jgi:REP element-mobilizing transposase RayT